MTTRSFIFFLKHTPTPEFYTLPLHAALPTWRKMFRAAGASQPARRARSLRVVATTRRQRREQQTPHGQDRKSTRLNSSHANISYAVFCLKKKNVLVLLSHLLDHLALTGRRTE